MSAVATLSQNVVVVVTSDLFAGLDTDTPEASMLSRFMFWLHDNSIQHTSMTQQPARFEATFDIRYFRQIRQWFEDNHCEVKL